MSASFTLFFSSQPALAVKLNTLTPAETRETVTNVRGRLGKVRAMLHDAHDHTNRETHEGKR